MLSFRALFPLVGLGVIPIAALARAAYLSDRPPESRPRRFVARNLRRPGAKVIACVGDSLTQGSVSDDYVARLEQRLATSGLQFINAGINGDLAHNALRRTADVLACQPDAAIVLVGTNDVLASLGSRYAARYRWNKRLPCNPSKEFYRSSLRDLTAALVGESRRPVALASLPPLGGPMTGRANQTVVEYNSVVREIAAEQGASYLPFCEKMLETVGMCGDGKGEFEFLLEPVYFAAARRYLLGHRWDAIAASRGYRLLTDGIHLSGLGGALLADLVESFVRANVTSSGSGKAAQWMPDSLV